jgi:hypothetical protein
MAETDSIEIIIDAKVGDAVKKLQQFDDQAKKTGKNTGNALSDMQGKFLAVSAAVAGTVIALKAVVDEAVKAAKIQQQLNAVLKSTGGAAGVTANEVNKLAKALSDTTTFEDDAIVGAQSLLLTFTNIGKDILPTTTEAVLDLSTAFGQDLKSSAIQLGKALNDPIQGVSALSRVGVQFTEQQKEYIKVLVESNRLADAQAVILREVNIQVGGSAKAAAEGVGAYDQLNNSFGDLKENVGSALNNGLIPLAKVLTDVIRFLGEMPQEVQAVTGTLAIMTPAVIGLGIAFGPVGIAIGATIGLLAALSIQSATTSAELKKLESDDIARIANQYRAGVKAVKDRGDAIKTENARIAQLETELADQREKLSQVNNLSIRESDKRLKKELQDEAQNYARNVVAIETVLAEETIKLEKAKGDAEQKRVLESYAAQKRKADAEANFIAGIKAISDKAEAEKLKREQDTVEGLKAIYSTFVSAVGQFFDVLTGYNDQWLENRLKSLEDEKQAQLDAFDASEQAANEYTEALAGISEAETAERIAGYEAQRDAAIAAGDMALAAEQQREIDKIRLAEQQKTRDAQIAADRAAVEEAAEENIRAAKRQAWEQTKAINIASAVSSTALAIINAFAQLGPIAGGISAGIIAGIGAAQVALIASQQVPEFADGGIVDRPTLAMVGEGGMSEAIVPLPDGSSIPVDMQGAGQFDGATINVYPQDYDGFITQMKRYARERGV